MPKIKIEKVPCLYFKDVEEKKAFLKTLKRIDNWGTVRIDNYEQVFKKRERLQKKFVKKYSRPDRIFPNRNSLEYREWRKAVFERDNYTCVECHGVGGKLEAHHIKCWADYPELRFDVDNGVTLCEECHKLTDTYLWRYFRGVPKGDS